MQTLILGLLTATAVFASESVFSVNDDVLAFPQYEIVFPDAYITEDYAASLLSDGRADTAEAGHPTQDLSQIRDAEQTSHEATPRAEPEVGVHEHVRMILHQRPFLCSIPQVEKGRENQSTEAVSPADQEKELVRATDRGWELLQDMEGKCMYYVSGWWSYSFCYKMQIKQFHQLPPGNGAPIYPPTEDPTTPSYVLGEFKPGGNGWADNRERSKTATDVVELQTQGETRYLVQKLSGGTTCDLTGKERRVEVQYHCSPSSTDHLGWIKEIATCTYLMVIYTPRLCNDIAFLPPRENEAHSITCKEILRPGEIAAWETHKAQEAKEEVLDLDSGDQRPVVGGIEIGARKQIGQEGKDIEKGKVAGEVQETTEVVVKKEKGKIEQLSKEDLESFNLDPNSVESMKKEMDDLAGTKDWKLEVVDGPGGARELRGIVQADSEPSQGGDPDGEDDETRPAEEGSEEGYKHEL